LKHAIKEGDMSNIDTIVNNHKHIVYYRNRQGASALHDAIEHRQFDVASNLLQRYPSLALAKDVVRIRFVYLFNRQVHRCFY
jgi:ankyrin repeat protein